MRPSGGRTALVPTIDQILQRRIGRAGGTIVNCCCALQRLTGGNGGTEIWCRRPKRLKAVSPGGRKPVIREEDSIVPKDLFDILPGFRDRRKPLVTLHSSFSCIV